jgi:hypothetical protein
VLGALFCCFAAMPAVAALIYNDAGRELFAIASADNPGEGQSSLDNPPLITSSGTVALFDENLSVSAEVTGSSSSADNGQTSLLTATGVQASGSFTAIAETTNPDGSIMAGSSATNEFFVTFNNPSGVNIPFTLTGTIENFDASGNAGGLISLTGSGGVNAIATVMDESTSFDFSGVFIPGGVYELQVIIQGNSESLGPPPFGDVFQSSSGNYDFVLSTVPIPAAVWLFGSGLLGLIGVSRRKKVA